MITKPKDKKRDHACGYIARWFYEADVPHSAATLPSFHRMLEAIGDYGRGLRRLTSNKLSGSLLQKRKRKVQVALSNHMMSWELSGCSIMIDSWTDKDGRELMNILVHSASGILFCQIH